MLGRIKAPDFDSTKLEETFSKWEHDRLAGITKRVDFTTKNIRLQRSSDHICKEAAKEWVN